LRGDDWSNAGLVEQGWRQCAHVAEEFPLELVGFACSRFDPAGEAAQREPGRELVRPGRA
jgi:hypothetical protein